jgi:hypothetical protein
MIIALAIAGLMNVRDRQTGLIRWQAVFLYVETAITVASLVFIA